MATDSKYLKDLVTECDSKAKAYENRQMLRKEELVAVNKAIEIMSSDDVTGSGEKYLPQFVQMKSKTKPHSMSLLRASSDSPIRKKLVSSGKLHYETCVQYRRSGELLGSRQSMIGFIRAENPSPLKLLISESVIRNVF